MTNRSLAVGVRAVDLLIFYGSRILQPFPFVRRIASRQFEICANLIFRLLYQRPWVAKDFHVSKDMGLVEVENWGRRRVINSSRSYCSRYEDKQDFRGHSTDVMAIAYHLPQFHAIPENDEWWGKGFTEWTNVKKAEPLFPGHYQPRRPHDDIGYYDLTSIDALRRQISMAKAHGIYGFCFYHYWFHGKRLLGKPVDILLENKGLEMPFCLCWANETWSKKWDGKDHHILIQQIHSPEDDIAFIQFLAPYFTDKRYIRINNKPLLLVYRVNKLPDPLATVKRWRLWCKNNGIGDLHIVSVCHGEVYPDTKLDEIGFDAFAAFPPHSFHCQRFGVDPEVVESGYCFDYESGATGWTPSEQVRVYEGCMLGWDNTARLSRRANVYVNYSLSTYQNWLSRVVQHTRERFPEGERLVFINAWNEWSEGTYLEPDEKYGYASLNATARALFGLPTNYDQGVTLNNEAESAYKYTQDYESLCHVIEREQNNSWAVVNKFIDDQSEVLEFGPASGYFTRYLKEKRGATVDIVEIDAECARIASVYARDCCVGDVEALGWKEKFAGRTYDRVLFADVLEHLRDPWRVLAESVSMLKPGGRLVISVPNIAHAQILASLYNNDFSYSKVGIMDRTHLRFFTETTLRHMAESAGLDIGEMIPIISKVLPPGCGTYNNTIKVPYLLKRLLSKKRHASAIQFVAFCSAKS